MRKIIVISVFVMVFIFNMNSQEIFDAIRANDVEKVKTLIESDKSVIKQKAGYGDTPLHYAALTDNEKIARLLITHGADVDAQNGSFYTPLMRAGLKVTRVLVESGADINFVSGNGQTTALFNALYWKDKEIAVYLLASGARLPEKGNRRYRINLINAAKKGISQYLDRCLKDGMDPLFAGASQSNLFHFAARSGSTALLDKLFKLGIPIHQTNIFGWTPLHNAAYYGDPVTVEWFIKKGADVNGRTADGNSPCTLALAAKKTDVVNFLKSTGADQSPRQFPKLSGEYMGQMKPGRDPVPFAPGIIAPTHRFHSTIAFSKNGNEAYWGCPDIMTSVRQNGIWTKPEKTSIIKWGDAPFFSPDGRRLYFVAQVGERMWEKEAIGFVERQPSGWSELKLLPDMINATPGIHFAMSVDLKGNVYFGARQKGTVISRILCSEHLNGNYSRPVIMPHLKNVDASAPYISPDGEYLIYSSRASRGLMVSFKKKDGGWTDGQLLAKSNEYADRCPIVSHDGKWLFFLRFIDDRYIPYWVSAGIIEELKPKNLE